MRTRPLHPGLVFAGVFALIFLLHLPLLRLPYFWDEAGYYVPAARDLLLDGSLIPHTSVSNAHPPLVMAWIALWWKVVGFAPVVTRTAMLMEAAFALLGFFRLAERASNTTVAIASTLCVALYSVFFAQSSLTHVDLAAAGFSFWGLYAYLGNKRMGTAVWFALAVLAKETAILIPFSLGIWEIFQLIGAKTRWAKVAIDEKAKVSLARFFSQVAPLLIPALVLSAWYAYHYARTGHVFGNPEFFRYNVAATFSLSRFLLALAGRLWQVFGYMNLWVLTASMLVAMLLPPLRDATGERPRVAIRIQLIFLTIAIVYMLAMALVGGAVLARYMLPIVPLVVIEAVATLWRRLRFWPAAVGFVLVAFVSAWFINPPYGFSPEDNLAYRDFVQLHEDAERYLEARYPMARVLTAWPANDELTRPWLGYVTRPMQVVRIEDFRLEEVLSAADFRSNFDVALVFSTKYEPAHPLLDRWKMWTDLKARFFGFHRDLPPAAVAQALGGRVVYSESRKGLRIAVIEMEHVVDAHLELPAR